MQQGASGPGGLQPGNYNASQLSPEQRNWLFQYYGHSGQAPEGYGGENAPGEISNYTPGMNAQQIASQNSADLGKQQQALYQQQQGSAISGLQTQQGNLAQQYKSLLDTIKSEYDPLVNKATTEENNFLGARGLVSNTGAGQTQLNQTLEQIYGQQAGATGQAIQGSISDYNSLAQAIAGIQAGGAGTAAQLPLQYGQLALSAAANPANIFATQAQGSAAQFIPIPGIGVYNMQTGQIVNSLGGTGGAGPSVDYTGNKIQFNS